MKAVLAHESIMEIMINTYLSIDDIKLAYNFGLDRASPAGRTELNLKLSQLGRHQRGW